MSEKQRKSTDWWKGSWNIGDFFMLKRDSVFAPKGTPGKIIKIFYDTGSKNFQYIVEFPDQKRVSYDGPTLEDMATLLEDDFHFRNFANL